MIENMKKYRLQLSTAIFTILTFVYTGCGKDKPYTYVDECAGVECLNGGTCLDGTCQCPNGFEGDNCEVKWLAKYIGQWDVTEEVQVSTDPNRVGNEITYRVAISADNGKNTQFVINGLRGEAAYKSVPCLVGFNSSNEPVGSTSFIFKENYAVPGTNAIITSGDGVVNSIGTIMSGKYEITFPADSNTIIRETVTFSAKYVQ